MRLQIDFDKKNRSVNILALERFLNYNLIGTNHGLTFEAIFITLIENPKKNQKYKRRFLYRKYADISVPFEFTNYSELNIVDFENAFETICESIEYVKEIESIDFNYTLLKADITALRLLLPKDKEELKPYIESADKIDTEIHLKRMNCRDKQRQCCKKELNKRVKGYRAYDKKETLLLRPYLNLITELLENVTKKELLLSPNYSEIYISISDNINDARTVFPLENWYEYAYIALDYNKFESYNLENRFYQLVGLVSDSLFELGRIDGLDEKAIERIVNELKDSVSDILTTHNTKDILNILKAKTENEKILLNRK